MRETVEAILGDIEARKDAAVRDLSQKFDNWSPASFKLAPAEIERAIGELKKRNGADNRQGRDSHTPAAAVMLADTRGLVKPCRKRNHHQTGQCRRHG